VFIYILQNEGVNNVFEQKTITYRESICFIVFMFIHLIKKQGTKLMMIVWYMYICIFLC